MERYVFTEELISKHEELLTNPKYVKKHLHIDFECVLDFQKRARKVFPEIKSGVLADFIFFSIRKAKCDDLIIMPCKRYKIKPETVAKFKCCQMVKDEILRLNEQDIPADLLPMDTLRELSDWDLYYLLNNCKSYNIDLGEYTLTSICALWNDFARQA